MDNKRLFGNLALSFASVIVALFIGEILLRLFYPEHIVLAPRYTTDAQYGEFRIRRLRPNSAFWHTTVDGSWEFITNAQGFRNRTDFTYEKPARVLRILSLGDSHTQGMEVRQEKTFSAVTERYLRGEGIHSEVINAGVSGFSTAEELVFLENEGLKYNPDVVVLGFYANDLEDNIKAGIFVLTEDGLDVRKKSHVPGTYILNAINRFALLRWLSENSYMYAFTMNGVWNYAKQLLGKQAKAKLTTEYAIPVNKVDGYQLRLMEKLIERMYAFCRDHDIRLIILDVPQFSENGRIRSSVPDGLYETLNSNSDLFIYSRNALEEYRNVAELHVPHGHRHISEVTHLVYGMLIARAVSGGLLPKSDPRLAERKRLIPKSSTRRRGYDTEAVHGRTDHRPAAGDRRGAEPTR